MWRDEATRLSHQSVMCMHSGLKEKRGTCCTLDEETERMKRLRGQSVRFIFSIKRGGIKRVLASLKEIRDLGRGSKDLRDTRRFT
mmetsp:Transcript_33070/g.38433  ORF Transcript_33070/g.38433 Transcript_33070/m.38433 type:complete len:85 (-) Transcript_33070:206-460(-)